MDTTMTQAIIDTTAVGEHEFSTPCFGKDGSGGQCEQEASWALWLSHTIGGCNVTTYTCDFHKKIVDTLWRKYTPKYEGVTCERCRQVMSGSYDDNVRWIAL